MTTQSHYTLELEQTARKHIQTPISYIGAYKMIWPMAKGSTGRTSALRFTGVALLLALFWAFVTTMFYFAIFMSFLWVVWLIFTASRRHRIRDARTAIATRDRQIGSGEIEAGR